MFNIWLLWNLHARMMQLSASVCRCQTSPVRASCSTACFIFNVSEAASNFALKEYQTIVTFPSPTPSRTEVYPSIPSIPSIPRWGWLHRGRELSSYRNTKPSAPQRFRPETTAGSQFALACLFFAWDLNAQPSSALQHCVTRFKKHSFKKQKTKTHNPFCKILPNKYSFQFYFSKKKKFAVALWRLMVVICWQKSLTILMGNR